MKFHVHEQYMIFSTISAILTAETKSVSKCH